MRKKWLSRALAAMLAGVLTVGLLAGCGAEEKKEESKAPQLLPAHPQQSLPLLLRKSMKYLIL